MELFDSHSHYDDSAFDADRGDLLTALPDKSVCNIVSAGTSLQSSRACIELARCYPYIYASAGIHPEEVTKAEYNDLEKIAELIKNSNKVVAVGEIGLDYHYDIPRELQITFFDRQLNMAHELDLPVIVHDRDAHGDTMTLLRKYKPRGVMHCYSGSVEMAKELISLGMYLGFTGSITFKNNRKAAEVISTLPHDRILIETDCPYMAPEPLRGQRCDSSMLRFTVARVAEVIGISPEEASSLTANNARKLFNISL